jgi:hypothetical protein
MVYVYGVAASGRTRRERQPKPAPQNANVAWENVPRPRVLRRSGGYLVCDGTFHP